MARNCVNIFATVTFYLLLILTNVAFIFLNTDIYSLIGFELLVTLVLWCHTMAMCSDPGFVTQKSYDGEKMHTIDRQILFGEYDLHRGA